MRNIASSVREFVVWEILNAIGITIGILFLMTLKSLWPSNIPGREQISWLIGAVIAFMAFLGVLGVAVVLKELGRLR